MSSTVKIPEIISTSRRTDLVGFYPDLLSEKLEALYPSDIHTIVLWTKNPLNIIHNKKLRDTLNKFDHIFIHLTITGLGGSVWEPGIPESVRIIRALPDIIDFIGSPSRITWRFDPILTWIESGKVSSNLDSFSSLAPEIKNLGITSVITSTAEIYPKILRRFKDHDFLYPLMLTDKDRKTKIDEFDTTATRYGFIPEYCCVPGKPPVKCIDSALLEKLHPQNRTATQAKARGQRELCGCSASRDIGWYSQKCAGGCLYCYANPAMKMDFSALQKP